MAAPAPSDANNQHGIQTYYRAKIAELEVQVREKAQNFRRLEAQRNEINAKGSDVRLRAQAYWCSSRAARGAPSTAGARLLRRRSSEAYGQD